ncbi:MAG: alanine--glyoxylate aminotransferase family protein [candidate division WOR-3 bacterium]
MYKKLFLPGPVEVKKEILEQQSKPLIGHRSKEFSEMYERIIETLRRLFKTNHYAFVFTASATGVMEGFIRNFVKEKVLVMQNGSFAERWVEACELNGKRVKSYDIEWGKAVKPEMVEEEVKKEHYDAVIVVHNESSTGVLSPLKEIGEVLKEKSPNTLLIVDAVTSMMGTHLELENWNVDAITASVQKAFGLPPGIAVAFVSQRAMEVSKGIKDKGLYFNFEEMLRYYEDRKQTPFTPNISLLYALDYQLQRIEREGLENRYRRHEEMARLVQDWALEYFDMFPEKGYWSKTITCIKNTRNIDVGKFLSELANRGYAIANGYGQLKNKTFRVGHMGDFTTDDIKELLGVMTETLRSLGYI